MFCRYCGKEILDQAVLCPHCGMMVKKVDFSALQQPQPQAIEQPQVGWQQSQVQPQMYAQPQALPPEIVDKKAEDLKTRLARVFGIIAAVFIGLSLAILLSGICSYLYYFEGYSSSQYNTELYDSVAAALLFGFIALGAGIATFILGLKQKNVGVRYLSTILFIGSIFAVFIPLVCS